MKNRKKSKNIILICIDIIIVLIVAYFVLGYFNFYKISHEEKPLFEMTSNTYKKQDSDAVVKVYDYKIYKIVEVKTDVPKKTITYSMKLWFMEDVK